MTENTTTTATLPTVYGVRSGSWAKVSTLASRDYGTQATMAAHLYAIRGTDGTTDTVTASAHEAGVALTRSKVARLLNTAELLADAKVTTADLDAARAVVVGLNAGAAIGACRKRVQAGELLAEVMADEAERAASRKAKVASDRAEATTEGDAAEATTDTATAAEAEPMTADHVTAWLALNTVTAAEYSAIVSALRACRDRSGLAPVARKGKATA